MTDQRLGEWTAPAPTRAAGSSTNRAVRSQRILDVVDPQAMPRGRPVVFALGAPAALVRTLPWTAGPHPAAVRASIAKHDPAAEVTSADAVKSLTDVEAQERTVLPA